MVHTLVPMSVKIKIKNFETPARLINHMELSCAVGMACRQASLPCPEGTAGTDLKEFVKSVPDTIYSSSAVDEKLKVLIRDYIYKKGEVLDDDTHGDFTAPHGGKQFVKLIRQSDITELIHDKMDMDGEPAAVYHVRLIVQLLE